MVGQPGVGVLDAQSQQALGVVEHLTGAIRNGHEVDELVGVLGQVEEQRWEVAAELDVLADAALALR